MQFRCSQCGKTLRVSDSSLAQFARCPACSHVQPLSDSTGREAKFDQATLPISGDVASLNPYVVTESPAVHQVAGTFDLGQCFREAVDVYKLNFVPLVLAAFLSDVLSLVSLFILCGPITGGACLMTLRALERPDHHVDLGDLFAGFRRFFALLGLFVVTLVAILLGFALCIVPGVLLATIWMFSFFLVIDRGEGVFQSLGHSYRIVSRDFVNFLLLCILSLAIHLAPQVVPYLGIVLTWFVAPLGWLVVASAYRQVMAREKPVLHK